MIGPLSEDAPLTPLGESLGLPKSKAEIRAEKARIRTKKNRDERKQQDPEGHKKKERERKQAKRTETKRKRELEKALDSGQFPTRLSLLKTKNGPPLTAINEFGKTVRVETGAYDTDKLTKTLAEQQRAGGGKSVFTPPAKPTAPDKEHDPNSDFAFQGSILWRKIHFLPTKQVKAMRKFIDSHFSENPMMLCSVCLQQIAPEFSYEAGFKHLQDNHKRLFEDMLHRARTAKKCPEDHEGMASRHATGTRKLYCKRCRKLLYNPSKKVRTDKTTKPGHSPNPLIISDIGPDPAPAVL